MKVVTDFGDVSVEVDDDAIGTVRLCRGPSNFFDTASVGDVRRALTFAAEKNARVVVLASEGKHFCAGMDFGNDKRSAPEELYAHAAGILETPLPIIAAVQGSAVGGGLGLALAADFRVACPSTRFWANFTRLGLHHGFGITVTLPAVVGQQRAAEMLMTARRVDGAEALAIGLCDRLVDEPNLAAEARRFAAEIAACAPLSVRATRETLRGDLADRVRAATKRELEQQLLLGRTEDFKEGIRASRERREPRFLGR
ncbi:enoyl-CoA hydratase/isomerase family protein [Nocardia vaccinii]|uniref:enoyl-CoA hydratase/isomerase family protein n=1 Tax=Nocardia vaccinii TaxID=1822 RepID=UPI00082F1FFF|nr:enoyl-CoA hydratase/isomerase family protein [Nocardia vaccinii]